MQFSGINSSVSPETVKKIFEKFQAPAPVHTNLVDAGGSGSAQFDNIQDAVNALILVNNRLEIEHSYYNIS